MNRKHLGLVMAYALLASASDNLLSKGIDNGTEPVRDFKRRICKSCKSLKSCGANPQQKACNEYKKRNK